MYETGWCRKWRKAVLWFEWIQQIPAVGSHKSPFEMWWNLWKNGQHAFRKVNNKMEAWDSAELDLKDTSLWAPLEGMKTWWPLMLILENMKYVQFYFCYKFSAVEEGSGYNLFVFRRDWAHSAAIWAQLCFSLLLAQLSLSSESTRGFIPHLRHFWCLSFWWWGTLFQKHQFCYFSSLPWFWFLQLRAC